jgi:hypothetical protein
MISNRICVPRHREFQRRCAVSKYLIKHRTGPSSQPRPLSVQVSEPTARRRTYEQKLGSLICNFAAPDDKKSQKENS